MDNGLIVHEEEVKENSSPNKVEATVKQHDINLNKIRQSLSEDTSKNKKSSHEKAKKNHTQEKNGENHSNKNKEQSIEKTNKEKKKSIKKKPLNSSSVQSSQTNKQLDELSSVQLIQSHKQPSVQPTQPNEQLPASKNINSNKIRQSLSEDTSKNKKSSHETAKKNHTKEKNGENHSNKNKEQSIEKLKQDVNKTIKKKPQQHFNSSSAQSSRPNDQLNEQQLSAPKKKLKPDENKTIKKKPQQHFNSSSAQSSRPNDQLNEQQLSAPKKKLKQDENKTIKKKPQQHFNSSSAQSSRPNDQLNEQQLSAPKKKLKQDENKTIKKKPQQHFNSSSAQSSRPNDQLNEQQLSAPKKKLKQDENKTIKKKPQQHFKSSSAQSSRPNDQLNEQQLSAPKSKIPPNLATTKKVKVVPCVEERTVVEAYSDKLGKTQSVSKSRKKRKLETDDEDEPSLKIPKLEDIEQNYEVEFIVGYEFVKKKHLYEVKWKGWASESNTWEPSTHLDNCEAALLSFIKTNNQNISVNKEEYENLKTELTNFEESELKVALEFYKSAGAITIPPPDKELHLYLESVSKIPPESRDPNILDILRKKCLHAELFRRREEQVEAIKTWEININQTISESKGSTLKIENNVDLELPPTNFVYVNEYVPGKGVMIHNEPHAGCSCKPSCSAKKSKRCCSYLNGDWPFPYTNKSLLRVPQGSPVYECNKNCLCGPDCENRVVQNGRKFSLCIFRTSDGRGWGVKALEDIPKGSFVTQYVGELITNMEADQRGKIYNEANQTYLFDLDFNDDPKYCVDAAVFGNESHFVNHSCDPNMFVFSVWANCLDPDMPNLAFFSIQDISAGEELNIDYLNKKKYQSDESFADLYPLNEMMVCKCGSTNCRKYYL